MDDTIALQSTVKPAADRDEVVARLRAQESELRQTYLVTALYLFGSAARDEMTPESDVDVFVDYDPEGPYSFVELIRGGEHLAKVLGRKVDYTTRDGLHCRLRGEIEAGSLRVF